MCLQEAVRAHEQQKAARQQCEEQLEGALEELRQARAQVLDHERREAVLEGQASELKDAVEVEQSKNQDFEDKLKVCTIDSIQIGFQQ